MKIMSYFTNRNVRFWSWVTSVFMLAAGIIMSPSPQAVNYLLLGGLFFAVGFVAALRAMFERY